MTLADLRTILLTTGYPVAYSHFKSPPKPPYLVYVFAFGDDLIADNINYAEISRMQVELYTELKDETAEGKVQTALKSARLPYLKSETWIDSEKLHQVLYELSLIGG